MYKNIIFNYNNLKNLYINFSGKVVPINMLTDLASFQQISEKRMFSPSDVAELIVSEGKDLSKKMIETEQDFFNFISDKNNKVYLDISQNSKLYLNNFSTLKKETEDNTKALKEALKKKDEIKKRKEITLKKNVEAIKK